jgi:hypothetical protein
MRDDDPVPPAPRPAASAGVLARWWKGAVEIDPRSLGLFRIGIAAVLVCDLVSRATDLRAHYTDWGILPRSAAVVWLGPGARLSPYLWLDGAAWAALLLALTTAAALLLLAGWRSRTMAALCFVLASALDARNPGIVYGGDNLMRALLFWMPWLPLPGAWAIGRRSGRADRPLSAPGVAAIRLQLCIAYWGSAAVKWNADWLSRRDAVLTALWYDEFVTSWGKVLRRFPSLMRAMAPATVALELLGPLLAWVRSGPVRALVVAAFVVFHLGVLGPALVLGIFPWVCAAAWALFVPTWLWERIGRRAVGGAVAVGAAEEAVIVSPASERQSSAGRGRIASAVLAVLVAYVALLAAAGARPDDVRLPPAVTLPARLVGLGEHWNMFARPPRDDGWLVMAGRLADGRVVDAWGMGPLDASKPASVSASFGNARWVKYLSQLNDRSFVHHRRLFAGYLCRRWNEAHAGPEAMAGLQLYFVLEPTLPGGGDGEPQPLLIWQQGCEEAAGVGGR